MWESVESFEVGNKIHKVNTISVYLWTSYTMANLLSSFQENPNEEVATKYIKSLELLFRLGKNLLSYFFNDGGIGNPLHLGFLFCFKASTKRRNGTKWNLSKIKWSIVGHETKTCTDCFYIGLFVLVLYSRTRISLVNIKDLRQRYVLLLRTHFDSQLRHGFVSSISR